VEIFRLNSIVGDSQDKINELRIKNRYLESTVDKHTEEIEIAKMSMLIENQALKTALSESEAGNGKRNGNKLYGAFGSTDYGDSRSVMTDATPRNPANNILSNSQMKISELSIMLKAQERTLTETRSDLAETRKK
jgi:hypothetical protein